MARQLGVAIQVANDAKLNGARILGIGCGTGWLENGLAGFGEVWGMDLSAAAIAEGLRNYPGVHLQCGDFMTVDLPAPFDLVVSADSLQPMPDHGACVDRVAELLRPGGTFLLMTQNPWIWERRSTYRPDSATVPHASRKEWANLRRIRQLLARSFSIERETTIEPGGDVGLLWWVEHPMIRRSMGAIFGDYRWQRLLEVMGFGRELVVIARRR
jgi:SAM-dependent methyltransferase